jgi:hypothetical protein
LIEILHDTIDYFRIDQWTIRCDSNHCAGAAFFSGMKVTVEYVIFIAAKTFDSVLGAEPCDLVIVRGGRSGNEDLLGVTREPNPLYDPCEHWFAADVSKHFSRQPC